MATPALRGRDILDLGCGRQPYKQMVEARSYTGVDAEMAVCPDVVATGDMLPFASGAFNGAICSEVLEHTPDPARVIAELRRVLKAGGVLYLTVPQMWYLHYEPHDYFRFTSHGLRRLLEDACFRVLRSERQGGLGLFLFLRLTETLHRLLYRFIPPMFSAPRRARMAAVLIAPLQLLGLAVVPVVDRFSKRDAIGWAVVAEAIDADGSQVRPAHP